MALVMTPEQAPAKAALPASEAELVAVAADGNRTAFERLYRRHLGRVYGLCLRMCRDQSEAEECAQEAFIQAWRKLHLFRGDSEFGTWLHRLTVNTVLQRMRKARRDQDRLTFLAEPNDTRSEADASAGTDDVEEALKSLPGGARSVVVLCGVYGYSHEEASAMLGIAIGTCKAQLHRARKLLAERLSA
ncbi:MAG: sigma-70 family RNA polymerase sigma factor [Pseudomonadota bacterium]